MNGEFVLLLRNAHAESNSHSLKFNEADNPGDRRRILMQMVDYLERAVENMVKHRAPGIPVFGIRTIISIYKHHELLSDAELMNLVLPTTH